MRKINVVVTDDIALRQKQNEDENFDPRHSSNSNEKFPKKEVPPSVEEELFGDFF